MIYHLKKYSYYYLTSLIFILTGLVLLLSINKGDVVMWFDGFPPTFKLVFLYVTKLAEVAGGAVILVLIIWKGKRKDILRFALLAFLALLVSQSLKMLVFPDHNRPTSLLELQEIDDLERHKKLSFPSGHTTGAFAMYGALAVALSAWWAQMFAAFIACSVGISRMVLGQHFLEDVVAGTVVGLFLVMLVSTLLEKFTDNPFWNRSIIIQND